MGSAGSWGSAHHGPNTSSERWFPRNCSVLRKRSGLLQVRPSLQRVVGVFFSVYLFFLSDGYKTDGPHFSFSLALLRRKRDIGISLNGLQLCSES